MGPFLYMIQATCTALLIVWVGTRGTFKLPHQYIHPHGSGLWLETREFHTSVTLEQAVSVQGALKGVRESVLHTKRLYSPYKKERLALPIPPQLDPAVQVAVPPSKSNNNHLYRKAVFRNGMVFPKVNLAYCGNYSYLAENGVDVRGVYDDGLCRVGTLEAKFVLPMSISKSRGSLL
jgi:hypothetical protein